MAIAKRLIHGTDEVMSAPLRLIARTCVNKVPDAPLAFHGPAIDAALAAMRASPGALARPVVVLGGYRSWPMMARTLRNELAGLTSAADEQMLDVSYSLRGDFDAAVRVARARIAAWQTAVATGVAELDVVGISMGGLVGRALAMGWGGPALRVVRLFTLASPHRGALLAERIAPEPAARGMRAGSAMLRRLDEGLAEGQYTLVPYAVLNDTWVGATRTAPPGHEPIWTAGTRVLSHFMASESPGIIADVARRLRGEAALAGPASRPPRD